METIKRAALAPAEPSGQDRSVAAAASGAEAAARQELAKKTTPGSGKESAARNTGSSGSSSPPKNYSYNQKGIASPNTHQTVSSIWGLA
jgi:hypothetical protein